MKPASDLQIKHLKKQKVGALQEIAQKYCIDYDTPIKKAELIDTIFKFGQDKCFEAVDKVDATKFRYCDNRKKH